ncbi:MAG: DUF4236 domain-containing protein [Chloroflexota bacterium]
MGFRIQRSIRLGKFVRMNISKSGVGFSFGVRGLRISTGPRGTQFSAGIPGTGLSYRKQLSSKRKKKKSEEKAEKSDFSAQAAPAEEAADDSLEMPKPGFFASRAERALAKGLYAYDEGKQDEAMGFLMEAAPEEPGAAMFAAAVLVREEGKEYQAIEMLENVIQSDDEFPTELMQKYLTNAQVEIDITPNVMVTVPMDGLAATLLLVELYQRERRVREAIALLEEIAEMTDEPVLTLSLVELYATRKLWDEIIERASDVESEDDITLETMVFYGYALLEKGLEEAAITVFGKALRRQKDRSEDLLNEARYWRAVIYQEQGKSGKANTEFQKIYAEDPNFRDVGERLATLTA